MSRYYYDLHIHSCLSPCCDSDMTPNNIVNMAELCGLNIIALTDHNSVKNCAAAMQVAKNKGITLIPGMELTCSEEIHVICLFSSLENATNFGEYVYARLPNIDNRPDIFGEQLILNSDDEIIGSEPKLLINATDISIENVTGLMKQYGGICFPAHIDKKSTSILSVLGEIPEEYTFKAVEITKKADLNALKLSHPALGKVLFLINSDAHYLETIQSEEAWLDLKEPTFQSIIEAYF